MINSNEIKKIKDTAEDLLRKMTITDFNVETKIFPAFNKDIEFKKEGDLDTVDLNIELKEPQILIGANGQTLFELQRILGIVLNKKLKKIFYLKLDINKYKEKKIEYLKNLAKNLADEVSLTKERKILPAMPAYQRRIIHLELAKRQDISAESHGDGVGRCIVIRPL